MADNDDPFARTDATRLRPRPGAGKRGWSDQPRSPAAPVSEPEPIADADRSLLGIGLNPLVRAASPLLLLMGRLRASVTPMDVPGLRRYALDEIRRFEESARAAGVQNERAAARYALRGADEVVLFTPGGGSEWAQHPPVACTVLRGGEKFFEMWTASPGIQAATST